MMECCECNEKLGKDFKLIDIKYTFCKECYENSEWVKKCNSCYGYGLWALGDPSPMGRIDAGDGMPTIPCPECGANKNPKVKK